MAVERPSSARPRRRGYTFVVVFVLTFLARLVDDASDGRWAPYLVFGSVGGIVWQLLDRRDLVDRLAMFAWVGIAVALLSLIPGARADEPITPVLLYGAGVVAGLVVAERGCRWRDQRRGEGAARTSHDVDPIQ